MKKKLLFLLLIFSFFLIGCKSDEEKTVEKFLNSKSIQSDIKLKVAQNYKSVEINFCHFEANDKRLSLYIYESQSLINFDFKNNFLFYKKGNEKTYTYIEPNAMGSIPLSSNNVENTDLDIAKYMVNEQYSKNTFSFGIDIKKMLEDETSSLIDSSQIGISVINCYGTIEDGKVNSFSIDFTSLMFILGNIVDASDYEISLTLSDITYADINPFDNIDVSSYTFLPTSTLIENIISDFTFLENDGNVNNNDNNNQQQQGDSYKVGWCEKYYEIKLGENIQLIGYLYKNDYYTIDFSKCNISYTPQLNLTAIGITEYMLTIEYEGHNVYQKISVNVVGEKQSEGIKNVIETGIIKSYIVDNYLLVADTNMLYKYNLDTDLVEGSVDLKCKANSFYTKDGFVYVAANHPIIKNDEYSGTISKIKLSNFTLEKQIDVEFYPYSIFVDKRGDIVVGKGEDQHIKYSIINIETGVINELVSGYERDYLVYNEGKDAFMAITPSHTGENKWYKYNGTTYENINDGNGNLDSFDYIYNNGEFIIDVNTSSKNLIVAKFDSNVNDYVYKNYTIPAVKYIPDQIRVSFNNNCIFYTLYDSNLNQTNLTKIDLSSGKTVSYDIATLKNNIEAIYCYNNKILICYYDGKILDVYSMI